MPRQKADSVLEIFFELASREAMGFEVTLLCGGVLVSGTTIPEREYFDLLADQLRRADEEAGQAGVSTALQEGLLGMGARARENFERNRQRATALLQWLKAPDVEPDEEAEISREVDELARSFVVLRDVLILGAGRDPVRMHLWRGRVADIAGWTLGKPNVG